DGHALHLTLDFIKYSHAHNIVTLCYPPHATHVFQGLNVAVFGVLKTFWTEECHRWEKETGGIVNKDSFLLIFGRAYQHAFTKSTILLAFQKTGVIPFD
ncbi:hypothetical protein BS47DRAFT_1262144, partial [Hydnum rufescens UP504]